MCGNYQWCRNETEFISFPVLDALRCCKRVWKETILKLHSTATNVLNSSDYFHNSSDIFGIEFLRMKLLMFGVTQCQSFDKHTKQLSTTPRLRNSLTRNFKQKLQGLKNLNLSFFFWFECLTGMKSVLSINSPGNCIFSPVWFSVWGRKQVGWRQALSFELCWSEIASD